MKTIRVEFDDCWKEAFGYAGAKDTCAEYYDIRLCMGVDHKCPTTPFSWEDVEEVYAAEEGENDGAPWRMLGKLHDSRIFYLEAGCDYTGWDCRAGGCVYVGQYYDLDNVVRYGMTAEARDVLGIDLANL